MREFYKLNINVPFAILKYKTHKVSMSISNKRLLSPLKLQDEATATSTSVKKVKLQSTCNEIKIKDIDYDDFFKDSDDLEDWLARDNIELPQVDLSVLQRCIVLDVINDQQTHSIILTVQIVKLYVGIEETSDEPELRTKCYLKDCWCLLNILKGDVVSLKGVWDDNLRAYRIDHKQGMCVIKPDCLISGTTVMGSLFCRRRTVLQERFRGIDANSKIMIIGSLVHELLQTVLENKFHTMDQIKSATLNLLYSQNTAFLLYSGQLTTEEACTEVLQFAPFIYKFLNKYVGTKSTTNETIKKEDFQGYITDIEDIEENLWVPQLGLKGKIDVSVRVHKNRCTDKLSKVNLKEDKVLVPLELKTGKASFSMEHKGQLILYQMMLTASNRPAQSGLLLYLGEGIMREMVGTHHEQRDLINLRNELCQYLMSEPIKTNSELAEGKFYQPFLLPEPISYAKACQQCPYKLLCCTFAKTDPDFHTKPTYGIDPLISSLLKHLTINDFEYFLKWCNILIMEEKEVKKFNNLGQIWSQKRCDRQQQGIALGDLVLSSTKNVHHDDDGHQLIHEFKSKESEEDKNNWIDFTSTGFAIGEYVIVSTYKRLAIAAGVICNITAKDISINLERNLFKNYADETFIIDKHESASYQVFNFTNLGILMDMTERSQNLRNIILKSEIPKHSKVLPKSITQQLKVILKDLNAEQRNAVFKALTTQNYLLIKGLPGTGKTQTLVAIIRALYTMNKAVLITSYTHSAVDNLLLRLKSYGVQFLRLGSINRVHPSLHEITDSHLFRNYTSATALAELYNTYNIIGVTCLGCSHPIFLHRRFDVCIVDEATQVMQPTILRPLFYSERFILVGDPHQLPPLIRSLEARQHGADISLFEKLSNNKDSTITLSLQYRMNKTITKLANELTYAGQLECATNEIKQAIMKLPVQGNVTTTAKWLTRTLQCHIDQAVILLDTLHLSDTLLKYEHLQKNMQIDVFVIEKKSFKYKYTNYCEAAVLFAIVHNLLENGYNGECIGIIAPYRAQVDLLKKLLQQYHKYYNEKAINVNGTNTDLLNFLAIEINTVDQYQGRDKDIIIYSCTRAFDYKANKANSKNNERLQEGEILEDQRRLTVAVTRAKLKLIIIGNADYIKRYKPFDKLLNIIPDYCKLKLENGKMDFEWQILLQQLTDIANFS